jgi:zinc protease
MLNEGAGQYDAINFQRELDRHAIYLWYETDKDNFYVHLKTQTKYLDKAMSLLKVSLLDPHFKENKIEIVKQQIYSILERKSEDPKYIAARKWTETVFGSHPYARSLYGSKKSLQNIASQDLRHFSKLVLNQENMMVAIVGDISKSDLSLMLDKYLSNFSAGEYKDNLPEAQLNIYNGRIDIQKDIPQSVAIFGTKSVPRKDKEFYPLYLANYILGGGVFESRLMQQVRERRGLAYSVSSYMHTLRHSGFIRGSVATDGEKINESIKIIKDEIQKLQENGVTAQELQEAKQYLIGSFMLRKDTNDNLARFLLGVQIEGLGIEFINKRNDLVHNVTLEQVNSAAKHIIGSNQLQIVVVGN